MMRSFFGFFISVAENPELILEQNIRDMNDQVPRMNESIAMVKANLTLLEKEEAKYKGDLNDLTAKVKAAIQAGRDDLAGSFAVQLEQLRSALARTQGQLTTARAAFDKALAVKKAFLLEKERKTREAMNAIADYRRSQWQKKVADVMEQFEVTGISMPEVSFRIVCSKGTYIRSLAHDLGQALGCGGYLGSLCRTRIGSYELKDALDPSQFSRKPAGT